MPKSGRNDIPSRPALAVAVLALVVGWAGMPGLQAESLWKEGISRPLAADERASQVGDILTVIVQESNSNSQEKSTSTARDSGLDAALETFLYSPDASGMLTHNGRMPAVSLNTKSKFNGGGKINNSKKMNARIPVRVVDVLPRGQLVIEGRRETEFSREKQTAVLRGVVRADDISGNNTVFSYQIADATITFHSHGTLTDSQKKGWFLRLWDKVSPF